MTIDPSEAATSLRDIAAVEQRTREAMFYGGSSTIFIMWGVLVACGHALAGFYPRSAGITWLAVSSGHEASPRGVGDSPRDAIRPCKMSLVRRLLLCCSTRRGKPMSDHMTPPS